MRKALWIPVLALLGGVAWFCQRGGETRSAEADLVIAGLGGFRGIIAEVDFASHHKVSRKVKGK